VFCEIFYMIKIIAIGALLLKTKQIKRIRCACSHYRCMITIEMTHCVLCVCVCVCVCVYVFGEIYMITIIAIPCLYMGVCVCVCMCVYVFACVYVCVCVLVCVHVCTCARMQIYVCRYIHTYIYICIRVYP